MFRTHAYPDRSANGSRLALADSPTAGLSDSPTPRLAGNMSVRTDSTASEPLTIGRRHEPDGVTLVLEGEIDFRSAPALERELHEAERVTPRRLVLDLDALEFLDSTAIHLLSDAQRRAEADGHKLVLTHVPGHAQRLFTLTGIGRRLTVE